MNEQKFRSEMARAQNMYSLDDNRKDYWKGYVRGLRRAYHGESFGTPKEHDKWFHLVDDSHKDRRLMGRGYIDGLAFFKGIKPGRPSAGDVEIGPVKVSGAVKSALESLADKRGVSVAEIRRQAYREYTGVDE